MHTGLVSVEHLPELQSHDQAVRSLQVSLYLYDVRSTDIIHLDNFPRLLGARVLA